MSGACHDEQLDEVEALKAIYDEVEILCDDEGLVALVVYIHPELPEGGKVVIQAEVNPAEDAEVPPEAFAGYAGASPSQTDIMELAKRKVEGDPKEAKWRAPALTRSESGRASRAEAEVSHLPPLRLHLNLPADYPESSAPEFQLASSWLDSAILSELCRSLDQKWQEAEGSPIIFTWAEALRYEVAEAFHFQSSAPPALLLHVLDQHQHPDGVDPRARAECENAMKSLSDLVLYDKRRTLDLWKQQQQLCNICFCEYPGSQFVHLGECPHAFCRSCVTVMAELHVTEGSISELLCPEPSCRAEISAFALGEVLDEQRYERWHSLKLQRVLMSELKGVVFCPRCEEGGRQMPVLPDKDEADGVPPVARCSRCEYVFCAKCLGLYHGRDPCLHPEERAQQAAMRRLENSQGAAEKRKLKREAEKGYLVCVNHGDELPWIDAAGYITEDQEPNMLEGDYVWAVHAGVPERITGSTLWDKQRDNICSLPEVLKDAPRPISIRLRRGSAIAAANRLRQRKLMEELLTLKEIARESQTCPNCSVRVQRSAGCNHMTCTQCRTHFCYRCGVRMDPADPYAHFRSSTCTTFDNAEVQRMALQERNNQGQGFVDEELHRLREEFGDQAHLFAQFQAGRPNAPRRGAEGRGNIAARLRMGEVQCPTCGQWNGRTGGLNHIRCGMCRSSYCGHCRRRIQGVITHHFRGENSCPQHAR